MLWESSKHAEFERITEEQKLSDAKKRKFLLSQEMERKTRCKREEKKKKNQGSERDWGKTPWPNNEKLNQQPNDDDTGRRPIVNTCLSCWPGKQHSKNHDWVIGSRNYLLDKSNSSRVEEHKGLKAVSDLGI